MASVCPNFPLKFGLLLMAWLMIFFSALAALLSVLSLYIGIMRVFMVSVGAFENVIFVAEFVMGYVYRCCLMDWSLKEYMNFVLEG